MKKIAVPSVFLVILSVIAVMEIADSSLTFASPAKKKGIGWSRKEPSSLAQLESLKVSWYYNWGGHPHFQCPIEFVPMIYSARPERLAETISSKYVLGFNEPDHSKQGNVSVQTALEVWSTVAAKADFVVAPAPARNPLKSEWFLSFMGGVPRPQFNFIAVHWYGGVKADRFISEMTKIYERFKKPIWVTEFAPQTHHDSETNPNKYSQIEVNDYIAKTVHWMEESSMVFRYAWYDSKVGTSALFDSNGNLTATGLKYSEAF